MNKSMKSCIEANTIGFGLMAICFFIGVIMLLGMFF
jgi:hypothetical protein